mgnify:CR=1 FL=1
MNAPDLHPEELLDLAAAGADVHHDVILQVGVGTDFDCVAFAADDHVGPDRRAFSDYDRSEQQCTRIDEGGLAEVRGGRAHGGHRQ